MNKYLILTIFCLLILAAAPQASADSLFTEEKADLYTNIKAHTVGDILTVVISESTSAAQASELSTSKSTTMDGGVVVKGLLNPKVGIPAVLEPLGDLDINPKSDFGGKGSTQSSGTFSGRLTVTVIEVLPNGNLVVEGDKKIKVNKDLQELKLRGTVNPVFITAGNTIPSYQLADVDLELIGKGPIGKQQKPGFLTKLFNKIF